MFAYYFIIEEPGQYYEILADKALGFWMEHSVFINFQLLGNKWKVLLDTLHFIKYLNKNYLTIWLIYQSTLKEVVNAGGSQKKQPVKAGSANEGIGRGDRRS